MQTYISLTLAPSCSFLTLAKSASKAFNFDFICTPLTTSPDSSEFADVVGEVLDGVSSRGARATTALVCFGVKVYSWLAVTGLLQIAHCPWDPVGKLDITHSLQNLRKKTNFECVQFECQFAIR